MALHKQPDGTSGIQTGKGPTCIITRKKTSAAMPKAKGMPAIISPIHARIAAINAVPMMPTDTPLMAIAQVFSKASASSLPKICFNALATGVIIFLPLCKKKAEMTMPKIISDAAPKTPAPLVAIPCNTIFIWFLMFC